MSGSLLTVEIINNSSGMWRDEADKHQHVEEQDDHEYAPVPPRFAPRHQGDLLVIIHQQSHDAIQGFTQQTEHRLWVILPSALHDLPTWATKHGSANANNPRPVIITPNLIYSPNT